MIDLTGNVGTADWKEASKAMSIFAFIPTDYPQDLANWLTSVSGAFDSNPLYPQILEAEREARMRDEEQATTLE
jgi:hypothetical protein